MKDELNLSAVMAGAVDFASSAAASADEADNSTFAMQAKIMALIANHRPAGRRPNSHSMCGAVGHVISECFRDGGGLAHLDSQGHRAWIDTKRRERTFGRSPSKAVEDLSKEELTAALAALVQEPQQKKQKTGGLMEIGV